ncbi:MAG: ABC transporter ATP-binding protein [Pseudomonadota bacterium]
MSTKRQNNAAFRSIIATTDNGPDDTVALPKRHAPSTLMNYPNKKNAGVSPDRIVLKDVGCHYGWRRGAKGKDLFWALRDLNLEIPDGTSLGVVGNNGAGKSTLLSLLAGIISPDCGHIELGGRTATLLSLNAGLDPNLTGRSNAILSGLLLGVSRKKIHRELDNIQAFSGLGEFFDQPARTYSTGMRARLGFAVTVYLEPDILLIDEVIGVGDMAFREKSAGVIKARMASSQTVILVSHSLPYVRLYCDTALWLDNGKMKAFGDCDEVLDAYVTSQDTPEQTCEA